MLLIALALTSNSQLYETIFFRARYFVVVVVAAATAAATAVAAVVVNVVVAVVVVVSAAAVCECASEKSARDTEIKSIQLTHTYMPAYLFYRKEA